MESIEHYKVFISYTKADQLIAQEIYNFIREEFRGMVEPFFAKDNLASGDAWKDKIKENLSDGDAIISLMTANTKNKPWLLVEWSAFWLSGKDYHVFLFDGLKESDLIQPMLDKLYVTPTDIDSVKGFINRISSAANFRPAPYHKAEDLIVLIKAAIQKQKIDSEKLSLGRYEDKSIPLPPESNKKYEIAKYFLSIDNMDVFARIFDQIKDDSILRNLVSGLIEARDYNNAIAYAMKILTPETQRDIAIDLLATDIEIGKLYLFIEEISKKNQPQMRIILNHLIDLNKEHSTIFSKLLSYVENTPTLHRIATHLTIHDKFDSDAYSKVVERIYSRNAAESRKLGEEMIDSGLEDTKQFDKLVRETAKRNQIEAVKLLLILKKSNESLFETFRSSGIITSESALRRLNGLE